LRERRLLRFEGAVAAIIGFTFTSWRGAKIFVLNSPMKTPSPFLLAFASLMFIATAATANGQPEKTAPAHAAVESLVQAEGAWVRSAVAGQQGTGAFMKLTARETVKLVGVTTPVAGTAEVHEMKLEGDIMRMRPVSTLDLPAGRTVELKPGGYHLMLLDLKQALKPGTSVPLTLVLRDAKGVEHKMDLNVPVTTQAEAAATRGARELHKR
jgi:copper(I)-binding protein